MRLLDRCRKAILSLMLAICLCAVVAPAVTAYAAAEVKTETQAVVAEEVVEDDGSMMILMGGALLIIVVAVVVAVSTFSGAIAIAANMDVDGE